MYVPYTRRGIADFSCTGHVGYLVNHTGRNARCGNARAPRRFTAKPRSSCFGSVRGETARPRHHLHRTITLRRVFSFFSLSLFLSPLRFHLRGSRPDARCSCVTFDPVRDSARKRRTRSLSVCADGDFYFSLSPSTREISSNVSVYTHLTPCNVDIIIKRMHY